MARQGCGGIKVLSFVAIESVLCWYIVGLTVLLIAGCVVDCFHLLGGIEVAPVCA